MAGLRGTSEYTDQPVAPHRAIKKGLLLAVVDAFAEHGVELRDITGSSRGDLVAVLGRDRQIHELGPLAW